MFANYIIPEMPHPGGALRADPGCGAGGDRRDRARIRSTAGLHALGQQVARLFRDCQAAGVRVRALKPVLALVPTAFALGCAQLPGEPVGQPPTTSGSYETFIDIGEIEIGGEALAKLEHRPVAVRARLIKTEYGTVGLFPKGKTAGESDAGRCIDLVYDPNLKTRLLARKGRISTLEGHFRLLGTLSDYTRSLRIDGIFHVPVCQIFSNVSPYPYFVVRSVR